jgi:hypothetical protein
VVLSPRAGQKSPGELRYRRRLWSLCSDFLADANPSCGPDDGNGDRADAIAITMANKAELVEFLDRRVFSPILRASASGRTEHEKRELDDVQERTRTEQGRYHHYESAQKLVEMYKSDLSSENAREVNAKLKRLNLPILADVKDEFLKLAS